jgi:hypothetical protein
MATFKSLPTGAIRGVHSNLYPILDKDNLPIGFSSSTGDVLLSAPPYSVSSGFTVAVEDDGKVFTCTTALTITIPAGLSPRPSFIVNPPATGDVSIAVTGGAQVNGGTSTLTRSRASNFAGVVIVPYPESDGYGLSGV